MNELSNYSLREQINKLSTTLEKHNYLHGFVANNVLKLNVNVEEYCVIAAEIEKQFSEDDPNIDNSSDDDNDEDDILSTIIIPKNKFGKLIPVVSFSTF